MKCAIKQDTKLNIESLPKTKITQKTIPKTKCQIHSKQQTPTVKKAQKIKTPQNAATQQIQTGRNHKRTGHQGEIENTQEQEHKDICTTPERINTEGKPSSQNTPTESPPRTPTMEEDTPNKQDRTHEQQHSSTKNQGNAYKENSWLNPKNTQRVISSFVARTENGPQYIALRNKYQALDQTTHMEDSYFEDQIRPINTPQRNNGKGHSPPKNNNRTISGGFLNSTPFQSYVSRGTTSNTKKSTKRKEQESFDIKGKKPDTKRTPEPNQPNDNTEQGLFENETEDQNVSVGDLIKKMEEQQQRNFQNQLKLIDISEGKELSISDIKADDQDKSY